MKLHYKSYGALKFNRLLGAPITTFQKDNSVTIAVLYGLGSAEESSFDSQQNKIVPFLTAFILALGLIKSSVHLVLGAVSLGVEWLKCDADLYDVVFS